MKKINSNHKSPTGRMNFIAKNESEYALESGSIDLSID